MDQPSGQQEKTEEATPRKMEEAIKEGNFANSTDLTNALTLTGGCLFLLIAGGQFVTALRGVMYDGILAVRSNIFSSNEAVGILRGILPLSIEVAAPFLAVVAFSALASTVGQQGGFQLHLSRLRLRPDKLHPMQGLKKIFSLKGVVKTVGASLRLLIVLAVLYLFVQARLEEVALYSSLPLEESIRQATWLILQLLLVVCLCLVLIGAIDFAYQRWQWRRDLRMTKQEVKDEQKHHEGDLQAKKRMQGLRQKLLSQPLEEVMKKAMVVVTNPTHVAVALHYEEGDMAAPVVIAKGLDHVALRIKELARDRSIPILENPSIARQLHRRVPLGGAVPESLYRAVAQILAFVYRLREERRKVS
jgi:flagellar biosynthetic protein FlhB